MLIILVALLIAALVIYWLALSPTSQVFGPWPFRAQTQDKILALSFDDGPNSPFTEQLLDLLDQEKVPATFFVVGQSVERFPAVVRRAAAAGHTVGNHSFSHQFRNYLLHPSFKAELQRNQAAIERVIGQTPALYRSPWLFRQPWLLASVKSLGLTPVSGKFINPWEIFQPTAETMLTSTLRQVKPGAILIFHDGYNGKRANRAETVRLVEALIHQLKTEGWRFVTVDQLLGQPAYQPKTGAPLPASH